MFSREHARSIWKVIIGLPDVDQFFSVGLSLEVEYANFYL